MVPQDIPDCSTHGFFCPSEQYEEKRGPGHDFQTEKEGKKITGKNGTERRSNIDHRYNVLPVIFDSKCINIHTKGRNNVNIPEKHAQFDIVIVTCEFEKRMIDIKVVFNRKKEVTGLWFLPAQKSAEYEIPSYMIPEKFREKEVTIGTGEWQLPGTLTLPKSGEPFRAAVLVHGSGPNDRDETIGPNKPFRDLAWGLASRGVAVLRSSAAANRVSRLDDIILLVLFGVFIYYTFLCIHGVQSGIPAGVSSGTCRSRMVGSPREC